MQSHAVRIRPDAKSFQMPDLDPYNLSCEDLLAAGSQDSQGKDGKFGCFPPLFLFIFATQLCDLLVGVWASGC